MQPSEIESMPFYEFEITMENLVQFLKEKNDAEKREYDKGKQGTPNTPKVGNFKVPKAPSMPNIKMPKLR